ncbi:MAG: Rap1a/Tai family immunity protein [Methylocella sp.]
MIAMFLDYARNHPELHEQPAAIVVADMMARRYPCHR